MTDMLLESLPTGFRQLEAVIHNLARLLMQRNLFPATHPSVKNALDGFMETVADLLARKRSVSMRIGDGAVRMLNFEVDITETNENSVHFLRKALESLSIGEIEILSGLRPDEVLAFVEIAAASIRKNPSLDLQAAWRRIENIRIRHSDSTRTGFISDSRLPVPVRQREEAAGPERNACEGSASMLIGDVLNRIEKISSIESGRAGKMIIDTVEKVSRRSTMVLLLKSLKEYDDYTFNHSINVAVIAAAIARRLGYSDEETGRIGIAAIMHDIGKIYVPREIIHKTAKLSPAEWQKVKRHPIDGERILREEGMDMLARRVAYEHHMRFDGKGYPMPKADEKCIEASHIVRIADTYDALTTKRPYRRQIGPLEALRMMEKGRGSEFHPGYFDIFLSVMGNVPIGSVLLLESGERVLVVEMVSGRRLPRVRIIYDGAGNPVENGPVIDLNEIDPSTGKPRYRVSSISDSPVRNVDVGKYIVEAGGKPE